MNALVPARRNLRDLPCPCPTPVVLSWLPAVPGRGGSQGSGASRWKLVTRPELCFQPPRQPVP